MLVPQVTKPKPENSLKPKKNSINLDGNKKGRRQNSEYRKQNFENGTNHTVIVRNVMFAVNADFSTVVSLQRQTVDRL